MFAMLRLIPSKIVWMMTVAGLVGELGCMWLWDACQGYYAWNSRLINALPFLVLGFFYISQASLNCDKEAWKTSLKCLNEKSLSRHSMEPVFRFIYSVIKVVFESMSLWNKISKHSLPRILQMNKDHNRYTLPPAWLITKDIQVSVIQGMLCSTEINGIALATPFKVPTASSPCGYD